MPARGARRARRVGASPPARAARLRVPRSRRHWVEAIGQRPRSELLSWVDGLELDRGRIVVDPETGRTGNPKYFAAGDAVNGGATVVEAVRGAKLVAAGIHAWLGAEP